MFRVRATFNVRARVWVKLEILAPQPRKQYALFSIELPPPVAGTVVRRPSVTRVGRPVLMTRLFLSFLALGPVFPSY